MHHVPTGPPRASVVRGLLHRVAAALRALLPRRTRRALPVLLVGMAVGVLALAVPVVSAALGGRPVSLDASSSASASRGESPVVMGVDGNPDAGTAATTGRAGSSPGVRSADTPSSTAADAGTVVAADDPPPGTTGGTPAAGTVPGTTSSSTSSSSSSSSPSTSSSSSSSAPAPSSPAPVLAPGASAAVLAALDAARTDAGCAPLTADPALALAAGTNSLAMAAQGTLAVLDPAGSAAVIDSGDADAASAVATWLADASNRAHLLDCDLTTAGAAEVSGDGGPWWTAFLA